MSKRAYWPSQLDLKQTTGSISEAHVDAPEENCGRANALLDEHIEQVASRFRELNGLSKICEGYAAIVTAQRQLNTAAFFNR